MTTQRRIDRPPESRPAGAAVGRARQQAQDAAIDQARDHAVGLGGRDRLGEREAAHLFARERPSARSQRIRRPTSLSRAEFAAYYRHICRRLEDAVADGNGAGGASELYPDPVAHCEVCRWRQPCETRRRRDDHLSLVAGISKGQIGELVAHDVDSTGALAQLPLLYVDAIARRRMRGAMLTCVKHVSMLLAWER